MPAPALSRAAASAYRGLLRWCRSSIVQRVPFIINPSFEPELEPYWGAQETVTDGESAMALFRRAFHEAEEENLDHALLALRELSNFSEEHLKHLAQALNLFHSCVVHCWLTGSCGTNTKTGATSNSRLGRWCIIANLGLEG